MTELSGGCQCGAVRYRITGPLGHAGICHCRMCQKAFGSWGAALVSVPLQQFKWTRGAPGIFRSSAPVARGFCTNCGTPLFMNEDGLGIIEVAIGTLDNPNAAPPTTQVGMEARLAWFTAMADLPQQTTNENNPTAATGRYNTRQHPDHDTETWP
jgi:hypothetical protein